ncbi:unnamed protein product [Schistosoma mattheei]|uniref:Uncharacterized protein n=1 Tax=Schistosoma mattheei TaxID=31246 RepID=A0A3P8JN47_9TREM|nr:unnamed protein product [Schistosoma mattheei]
MVRQTELYIFGLLKLEYVWQAYQVMKLLPSYQTLLFIVSLLIPGSQC